MITVSKGVLKAKMLEYFRNIEATGEELIVTSNKRPVLKIIPINQGKSIDILFEKYKNKLKYNKPLDEPETDEWGELK
jgi:antitoxin (DNA-binding transcriptional repressor) of toxin-antitoxin stability system